MRVVDLKAYGDDGLRAQRTTKAYCKVTCRTRSRCRRPELGEVGEVVLLEPAQPLELPLLMPDALPEAPLELDLLGWASHSARDAWPSSFVSTSEKLAGTV